MSYGFLPAFVGNAEFDAERLLPQLEQGTIDLNGVLAFCRSCRIKAIGGLLMGGSAAHFHEGLAKSGQAFLHFLRMNNDDAKVTSRSAPFFDAIAAGDDACAAAIAQSSRAACDPRKEYEEDFLYVHFVMKHFFLGASREECAALLERYKALLEDEPDARYEVCAAFLAGGESAFHDAVADVLMAEAEKIRAKQADGMLPQEVAATEGVVNIEGLALLTLGERKGFRTEANYLGAPSNARVRISAMYPPDSWRRP